MKKRIGALFCALLAMAALTLSFALPASAADDDDTIVIQVYFYDADGNMIEKDPIYGMALRMRSPHLTMSNICSCFCRRRALRCACLPMCRRR